MKIRFLEKEELEKNPEYDQHQKVARIEDTGSGLIAFIAVHNDSMGGATGGTRMFPYRNEEDALSDVLQLSKAMTYKCAGAEVPHGGGKAVIMGDPKINKNKDLLHAYARALEIFNETIHFDTGTDVGVTQNDVEEMRTISKLINGSSGQEPSPYAALSTFMGIIAAAEHLWGTEDLSGKRVGIKGVGKVGKELMRLLQGAGAEVIVSEINTETVDFIQEHYPQVKFVDSDDLHKQAIDIYCPCAMGGDLTPSCIEELQAQIICGAANNQLTSPAIGKRLLERGVIYVPDFIANAGGLINVVDELADGGYDKERVLRNVTAVKQRTKAILEESKKSGISSNEIAKQIAETKFKD